MEQQEQNDLDDEKPQSKPSHGPIIQDEKPDWPHYTSVRGTWTSGDTYIKGDWVKGLTKDGKICWT